VAIGDRAGAASAELAWPPASLPKAIRGSGLYGFADAARVKSLGRVTQLTRADDLSSTGLGVRMAFKTKTVLGLEGAYALSAPPELGDDIWRFGLRFTAKR
jgi:hemolysin activation/secretion protein